MHLRSHTDRIPRVHTKRKRNLHQPTQDRAMEKWPTPRTKKDVQSFLGLIIYYRRFIKNFSAVAKPLTELTKDIPLLWVPEAQAFFDNLKKAVTTASVLQNFHPNNEALVTTDGSANKNRSSSGTRDE